MCNRLKTYFLAVFFIALIFPRSVLAQVKINEILPNPPPGENEWVELYNTGNIAVGLSGWVLSDNSNHDYNLDVLNEVLPQGLTVYVYSGGDGWLNNSGGESLYLKNNQGEIVDQYSYSSSPEEGESFVRCPDGSDNWISLSESTKGMSNPKPTSTPTPAPTNTPVPEPTAAPQPTNVPTPQPPSSTPVPVSTPRPTSTPKPTATPKLSPTPSLSKDDLLASESAEEILGTESASGENFNLSLTGDENSTPGGKIKKGKFNFWPFVFIIPGLGMISFSVLLLRKQKI